MIGAVSDRRSELLERVRALPERPGVYIFKDAKGRVQLFRLAWDFVGDSWGGRQELYERNFFGDNERFRALLYQFYDKSEAIEMVQRILEPPTEEWPFALPRNLGATSPPEQAVAR